MASAMPLIRNKLGCFKRPQDQGGLALRPGEKTEGKKGRVGQLTVRLGLCFVIGKLCIVLIKEQNDLKCYHKITLTAVT